MSKRKAKVVAEPEVQQEVTELSLVIESSPEQEEVLEKEAKEIVASKGTKEMFEEWFSEEGNKKMIAEVSNSLREKFKNKNGGWFTLRDMTIFTSYKKIEDALGLLNLIKLGGLLVAEMKGGKEYYKVVLTNESKLRVLFQQKTRLEQEIKEIEEEIISLQ